MRSTVLIVMLALAGGLAADAHARQPNVILLVADDMRADAMGATGNRVIRTPNLDALAAGGAMFSRAIASNPICTASRAEILTGCTSFRNGVMFFDDAIARGTPLWPAAMRDAGYQTWYVGKWHNDESPLDHGYAEVHRQTGGMGDHVMAFDDGLGKTVGFSSQLFADAAIEFIQRKSDRPFFLHVNFTAPHDPREVPAGYENLYDPAKIPLPGNFLGKHPFDDGELYCRDEKLLPIPRPPAAVKHEIAIYYAMISHLDAQVGRIVEALRDSHRLDDTIIIFTSDSGLALGSHGLLGKQNMYDHSVGVPLILAGPGVPKNFRSDAQCTLRDLFPTIVDLAGVEIPRGVQGESLAPVLAGQAPSKNRAFVCGYYRDVQRMIRTDRWKLIAYPHLGGYQLFDLRDDPLERRDLAFSPAYREVMEGLKQQLLEWQKAHADPLVGAGTALVESSGP